jgi:hypothetical protein
MSTKTTFKRVALVAVAALGFGMLSVVPSSAGAATAAQVGVITLGAPGTGRVGTAITATVKITEGATPLANADNVTLRAMFVSVPAGSTAKVAFSATGAVTPFAATPGVYTAAGAAGNELYPAKFYLTASAAAATSLQAGVVGFIPDVVGSYVLRVWNDADLTGSVSTNEVKATDLTFTVGAAPAAITVTKINGTTAVSGTHGALVKIALTDANGLAAGLANGESIRITPGTTTADIYKINGTDPTYTPGSGALDLTYDKFVGGVTWLNLTDSAAATVTFSLAGQGTSVSTLVGTFSVIYATIDASATATTIITGAAATQFVSGTDGIAGTNTTATIPLAAKTITYYTVGTVIADLAGGAYAKATVTDSDGRVSGSASQVFTGLSYDVAYLMTANAAATGTTGSFTVSLSPTAANQGFNVTTGTQTSALVSGVTTALVATSSGIASATPAAVTLQIGAKLTYAVTVTDQFGRALSNSSVRMVITGRNGNQSVVPPTTTTDADGIASFTLTDGPVAGQTSLSDSIVFTATGFDGTSIAATAVTITWSATAIAVGTVTILGGDNGTTTGVASTTPNVKDIAAGDGAQAGTQPFIATVKDAAGNLLAGIPVTFTVSGTSNAVLSTTVSGYTSAAGTVSASVYGWIAGTYTVTATAGDKSGTAGFTVAQQTALEARAISATVSGTIVTSKVVDRFGNVVAGVTVYATKTGPGFFGAGVTSTSAVTNTAGIAEFVIAGGDAEVTVSTLDPNATAGTKAYGQTCAAATFVGCLTTSLALTAATVGTSTAAETGVGASLSAAGVSSAKVSVVGDSSAQAAADAAAEATDAANAATDAANAAAEAADAATAAAQDAADAVAALSTQVSEMVNALKKQITALTNLVIKIQKKVKA